MRRGKIFLLFLVIFCVEIWTGTNWKRSYYAKISIAHKNSKASIRFTSAILEKTQNENCKPHMNIMLLKTHKTGSTTVQNIIVRHAKRNYLFVGLPRGKDFQFQYSSGMKFHKRFLSSQHEINILCHHMRFDSEEVASVMPQNTKYLTILREPAELFASYFDYFHYSCDAFKKLPQNTAGLQLFLNDTNKYFTGASRKSTWWFAKNAMAFDLGFDNLREDVEYIKDAVAQMQKTFHLVLIKEYFEESIILMKDLLCLSLNDVQHLHLNSRLNSEVKISDQKTIDKIRKWNKLDTALYDHFNETFWRKVDEYGQEKMRNDVAELKKLNSKLQETCIDGGPVHHDSVADPKYRVFRPKGVQTGGFNLKKEALEIPLCQEVSQIEREWHKYLKHKQQLL